MDYIPVYVLAYLIGSIPFGLILAKIGGHGDIRNIGSGNIGATNVLRTGNKGLAAVTLLLDSIKGAAMVFAAALVLKISPAENAQAGYAAILTAGFIATIGHCFPVWLKFKGGKGVATTIGVLLAAVPVSGLVACAIWLASAFAFRISSLAALIATAFVPVVTYLIYGQAPAMIAFMIALLIFWRHKDNIGRIRTGTESKIGKKS